MEIETLNMRPPAAQDKEQSNSSLMTFDLPELIYNMKHSTSWVEGELNARVLLNNPEKQIILTALHEKTEVNSFQSKDSITIQIIEGELLFYTNKDSVTLYKGQLLTLREKIKYRITTAEETVFLLTISNQQAPAANIHFQF